MIESPKLPDNALPRIEGDFKIYPDGRREPLSEYEKLERDLAASGQAHDEFTRRAVRETGSEESAEEISTETSQEELPAPRDEYPEKLEEVPYRVNDDGSVEMRGRHIQREGKVERGIPQRVGVGGVYQMRGHRYLWRGPQQGWTELDAQRQRAVSKKVEVVQGEKKDDISALEEELRQLRARDAQLDAELASTAQGLPRGEPQKRRRNGKKGIISDRDHPRLLRQRATNESVGGQLEKYDETIGGYPSDIEARINAPTPPPVPQEAPHSTEHQKRPFERMQHLLDERGRMADVDAQKAGVSKIREMCKETMKVWPRRLILALSITTVAGVLGTAGAAAIPASLVAAAASSLVSTTASVGINRWLTQKEYPRKYVWAYTLLAGVAAGGLTAASINWLEQAFSHMSLGHLPNPEPLYEAPAASQTLHSLAPDTIPLSAPESLSSTDITPPDFSDIHESAVSPHVPALAEYSVNAGGDIARHGLEGYVQNQLFSNDLFSNLTSNARDQFIDALRRTLVENPDLARQFITSSNGAEAVIRGGDLVVHAGDVIHGNIFQNPDFLRTLRENILMNERAGLVRALGGTEGIEKFIDGLRAIARK